MNRRLLAVAVAIVLAAVGCLAVVAYVRRADERAIAGRQAVRVLVATDRIPAGTTGEQIVARKLTKSVVMPADTVPADAVDRIDDQLGGLAVTADLQPSQLLLRGGFGESTAISGGLAVPAGKLAVSVEMSAAGRVAGYVRPGSKVAVFDTFTVREGKGRVPSGTRVADNYEYNHATRVLLPRIEVIGIGERGADGAAISTEQSGEEEDGGKTGTTLLVTLAATQDEAEKLIHASVTGTLSFALLDDTATIEPGPGVDNNSLFP